MGSFMVKPLLLLNGLYFNYVMRMSQSTYNIADDRQELQHPNQLTQQENGTTSLVQRSN